MKSQRAACGRAFSFFAVTAIGVLLFSLLVLPGCGPSLKDQVVGMWRLESCEVDGESFDRADIEQLLEEEGNYTLLGVADSGDWASIANGTLMGGTWSEASDNITFVDSETGRELNSHFQDGIITLEMDGIVLHFSKQSDSVPEPEHFAGTWNVNWDEEQPTKPAYDSMVFSDDGKCELDSSVDFLDASGSWRYACGICAYEVQLDDDPSDSYTAGFTGDEFVLRGPVSLTFSKEGGN